MPAAEAQSVMVIEDDLDTQANLRDILQLDEYQVRCASSAEQALRTRDWSDIFAIILDRRLPDGAAEQVLPKLRRLAPQAAVVIVTGYPDLEGAVSCLRLGAADYILKPISADALRASLGNIAERRRLELARRRSENTFRNLVDLAECMIVILRRDHRICYFSPFAERVTGYAAAEVLGRDYFQLILPDEERQRAADEFQRIWSGDPVHQFESAIRRRDESLRTMLWNARLLDDYEGEPGVLGVGQDITEFKRAHRRVLQSERLAAIGQMVTGLAHESRNALQRSKACLEMLALEVQDRPDALDLVARVHKAQDHLHRLYEEVREYAAPINLHREPCRLDELWRETWSSLALARGEKSIVLAERGGTVDLSCDVDAFAIGQVFRNILENAIAACPPEGRIEIAWEEAGRPDLPLLRLRFRDNGPGLGPEQRAKIFDPFFTTKTKGTGLGMAIARRIVEAHGGAIEVGSNGPGAEIVVALPRKHR